MTTFIATDNLNASDLPKQNAKWEKIINFASTFDIQSEYKNGINISGLNDINDKSTVKEIRAALYAEWRRYNHQGYGPDKNTEKKAWEAIELIRSQMQ